MSTFKVSQQINTDRLLIDTPVNRKNSLLAHV